MKKKPWEMIGGEFYEFAKKGKLYEANGEPTPREIGTGETPLALGRVKNSPTKISLTGILHAE